MSYDIIKTNVCCSPLFELKILNFLKHLDDVQSPEDKYSVKLKFAHYRCKIRKFIVSIFLILDATSPLKIFDREHTL